MKKFLPSVKNAVSATQTPARLFINKAVKQLYKRCAILIILTLLGFGANATTYIVTNLNDSGTGSLRQAITDANGADGNVVVFAPRLSGTISILGTYLITASTTINGNGLITLDGADTYSIMAITDNTATLKTVVVRGLNFANGRSLAGSNGSTTLIDYTGGAQLQGGISCRESLTVDNCTFSGCQGAINCGAKPDLANHLGSFTVTNCKFLNNYGRNALSTSSTQTQNLSPVFNYFNTLGAILFDNVIVDGTTKDKGSITGTGAGNISIQTGTSVTLKSVTSTNCSGGGFYGEGLLLRNDKTDASMTILLENVTVANITNVLNAGGAAWFYYYGANQTVTANNCTFYGSTGGPTGSARQVSLNGANTLTFNNCIIAGAESGTPDYGGPGGGNTYTANYNNCVLGTYSNVSGTNNTASRGNLTTSPAMSSLAYNGGLIETLGIGSSSSAINLGSTSGAPTADARGFVRDGSGSKNDAGAYERAATTFNFKGTTLPVNNTTNAPNDGLLTIDYGSLTLAKGTGNIKVYNGSNTLLATVDVTSANVSVNGSKAVINAGSLPINTVIYVNVDAGAFTTSADAVTATSTAISGTTAFTFTTANVDLPIVTSSAATSIAGTTATLNGNVSADGGATVTEKGAVWSATANPTTGTGTKVTDGSGTGAIAASATGLTASTVYHFRAYATNSQGTSYGSDLTFTTTSAVTPPATPATPTVAALLDNGFALNWTAVSGATSYKLDVSTVSDFSSFVTGYNDLTVNAVTKAVTGLTKNTIYYFRIRAVNGGGTSASSTVGNTTTPTKEDFLNIADGISVTSFTNAVSGMKYTFTGKYHGTQFSPNGHGGDAYIIDNFGTCLTAAGSVGSIRSATAGYMQIKGLWVFPSQDCAVVGTGGNVVFIGKKDGVVQYTNTVLSASLNTLQSNNQGFTYVDFTQFTTSSTTDVDEIEVQVTGALRYAALDDIYYTFTPLNPASNISFASTTQTGTTISWTNGTGVSRAVFVKAAASGTPIPVNNTNYTANTTFGSGTQIAVTGWYCVYKGTGTSVAITGLTAGTTYQAMAVEYNGATGAEVYSILTGTNNPNGVTSTAATPVISTTGTLSALTTTAGTASASTTFSVSGVNMTAGILVTPPSGFEVSTNNTTFSSIATIGAAGTIASTPVYVRLAAADAANTYSGNIVLSSSSATSVNVATVSSTVTPPAILLSSSPTITFSNNTGFGDNIAEDGEGGSTAISDINIQSYPINSSGIKLTGFPIEFHQNGDSGWAGYPPILVYTDGTNGSYGWSIKSSDGSKFSLASINFLDWGGWTGDNFKIEAFNGGISKGILEFAGNTGFALIPLSQTSGNNAYKLPAAFGNVDEVRLYKSDLTGSWVSFNNIKVGSPVVSVVLSTLTTGAATNVLTTSATLGGNVTNAGGGTVTERGIVWATTASPTISNHKVTNGTGTGTFSATVSSLPYSTLIHYRAYATNGAGTAYGTDQTFTTTTPGSFLVTDCQATDVQVSLDATLTASIGNGKAVYSGDDGLGNPLVVFWCPNYAQTTIAGGGTLAAGPSWIVGAPGQDCANGTPYWRIASSADEPPIGGVAQGWTDFGAGCGNAGLNIRPFAASTTVSSIARNSAAVTKNASENFTITFAGAVTGLTASNFSLTTTGTISGASVGTISGSGTTWTVAVNTGSGEGNITLNLANATNLTPGVSTTLPFAGGTYTVDRTAPTIAISAPSASSTNTGPVSYTITYTDANFNTSTLNNANVTLNKTGTADGTVAVTGSGTPRTVNITNISGTGTLGISIAAGTASDNAGNTTAAAGPSTTFSVAPALTPQTITYAALPSTTYGAVNFSPGATSDNNGIAITYSSNNTAVAIIVSGQIHIVSAGTAIITAHQAGDGTHNAATDVQQTLTVGKPTLTITANGVSKVPGTTLSTVSASTAFTTTGLQNGETAGTVTITYGSGASAGDPPGTYTNQVVPSALTGGTINASNYNISYVNGNLLIGTSTITVSVAGGALQPLSTSFGSTSATTTFTVSGSNLSNDITITPPTGFEVASTSTGPYGSTVTLNESAGGVGTTNIYVRLAATTAVGNNYNGNVIASSPGATSQNVATQTSTVNAVPLTITASNVTKTYGSAITGAAGSTAYTISSGTLKNGNTISSVTIAYGTGAATNAAATTNTGSVTPSAAIGANGFLTSNYNITYATGNIIVDKATLTITATGPSKTYGTVLIAGSSITNFTAGTTQNSEIVGSVTLTPDAAGLNAATAVGAGYVVTPSAATGTGGFLASNYNITYIAFNGTVSKANLTVTATGPSKTYGTALTTGTSITNFTTGATQNSEVVGSVTLTPDATGLSATTAAGASYVVTPSAATGTSGFDVNNYNITYVPYNGTVAKAALTVTANNKAKTYGQSLTGGSGSTAFTSTGLQNSETIGTVAINYGTGASTTSVANTYTGQVTPSFATGGTFTTGNYNITYTVGDIIVGAAPLTVTANNVNKIQGNTLTGGAGSTAFTTTALQNSETVNSVTIAYGSGAATGDLPGTYTGSVVPSALTGGSFTASNYIITYTGGNIIIGTPTITATGTLSVVNTNYGTASGNTSFTVSGANLPQKIVITAPSGFEVSTSPGSGFNTSILLTPSAGIVASTTIYVRLAATTVAGTYTGNVVLTSTNASSVNVATAGSTVSAILASVVTDNITIYDKTTATYTGSITSNGGSAITEKGVVYSLNANPTTADNKLTDVSVSTSISANATGLSPGTYYHARAYAINIAGTSYGPDQIFKTAPDIPILTTNAVTVFGPTTATFSGNVTTNQGAGITENGVVYSTSASPTITDTKIVNVSTTDAISVNATGLSPLTTYHVRAYATNAIGTGYGSDRTFTSQPSPDDALSGLLVGGVTITPGFIGTTLGYSALVSNATTTVAVTPTSNESHATIQLSLNNGGYTNASSGSASSPLSLNVGVNTIKIKVTAQDGTTINIYTLTITRDKAAQTITFAGTATKIYGDVDYDPAATSTNNTIGITYVSDNAAVATIVSNRVHIVGAGTANITSSQTGSSLYYAAADVVQVLTVNKKAITVTADVKNKTYGDTDPALTYTFTPALITGDSFTGVLSRVSGENIGTRSITKNTLALSSNYTLNYTGADLTITSKAITVTADVKNKTYGDTDPALTYTFTPVLITGDSFTGVLSRVSGENIGTRSITKNTLALSSNYTLNYTGADLTITAKAIAVTADAKSKTYGDTDPSLTYTFIPALVTGDSFSGVLSRVAGENIGTRSITKNTLALSSNYTLSYSGADLTITAKAIAVTADAKSKTYGDTDPSLTYTFTPALITGDSFTGALNRATGEGASTYAIGQNTLVLSNNYTLSYAGADLTIGKKVLTVTSADKTKVYGAVNPALTVIYTGFAFSDNNRSLATQPTATTAATTVTGAGTYTITSAGGVSNNYTFNYVPGTLTITPAALMITLDNKSKAYGSVNPALTATYSGFVNGDSNTNLTTQPTITTTATATSGVGTYPITATGAQSNNYTIAYTNGTLTITNVTLTITANNQSKTYGQANPVLTASYSGFVNGDTQASFTTLPAIATTANAASGANTYPITVSGAVIQGYTLVYVPGTITINKASLTITADNKAKIYGTVNPALTANYTGFVNGDNSAGLTTQPTITNTATATTAPGSYDITINGAASNNYTISYTNGTLTIIPLTISAMTSLTSSTGTLSPAFTAGTTTYSLPVSYDTERLTLTPTYDQTASATINGTAVPNGSPSFSVDIPVGTSTITVVITAQDGITKTTYTISVYKATAPTAIIPTNIISPNGDGKNDGWVVKDIEQYPDNEVTIYDTGGREVYKKKGYHNDWDGTISGAPLAQGTYFYIVDFAPGITPIKGYITILISH